MGNAATDFGGELKGEVTAVSYYNEGWEAARAKAASTSSTLPDGGLVSWQWWMGFGGYG